MPSYLVKYHCPAQAAKSGKPPAGTVAEIATWEALEKFRAFFGDGQDIVLHAPGQGVPWWTQEIENGTWDKDDAKDEHTVVSLPDGWRDMPWLTVLNGS